MPIKAVYTAPTDCQPTENVEVLHAFMLSDKIKSRPVWKSMRKQSVKPKLVILYHRVLEELLKIGFANPHVSDDEVHYIVDYIKGTILE